MLNLNIGRWFANHIGQIDGGGTIVSGDSVLQQTSHQSLDVMCGSALGGFSPPFPVPGSGSSILSLTTGLIALLEAAPPLSHFHIPLFVEVGWSVIDLLVDFGHGVTLSLGIHA